MSFNLKRAIAGDGLMVKDGHPVDAFHTIDGHPYVGVVRIGTEAHFVTAEGVSPTCDDILMLPNTCYLNLYKHNDGSFSVGNSYETASAAEEESGARQARTGGFIKMIEVEV